MGDAKLPLEVKLKDGRMATIDFLKASDSAHDLQRFINAFVDERSFLGYDRRFTLKEEEAFKKMQLSSRRKKEGYLIIARVGGKLAGSTGARREKYKGRHNISLGIAIAKPFRRIGLGRALLLANIGTAKRMLKPKNIFLSVLAPNKRAKALYWTLGFREFAVFPKWMLHKGKYVDHIFMKLER
jgi:RimJ/RimL family protein N-acetyltransferase